MKKNILIWLFLLPFFLYGQEKITDINEISAYQTDQYFEKDGKNYFVNSNNGLVRILEYNHPVTTEIARIEMPFPRVNGNYLLGIDRTTFYAFNITTKELKKFPFSNEYEFYRYLIVEDGNAILKANYLNAEYPKYFVCDFETGITELPSNFGTPVAISGPYAIFHSWSAFLPDYSKYTLIHLGNLEKVVILDNSKSQREFTFIGDEVWFYDAFDFAKSYDISENKFQSYASMSLDFDASKQLFFKKDSLLISITTANVKNSAKTLNLNTGKLVHKYTKVGSDTHQWQIGEFNLLDSCLVSFDAYSNLVKYNFIKGKVSVFPASLRNNFTNNIPKFKIKNRSVQYADDKLFLIDIKTEKVDTFNWKPPLQSNGHSYLNYYNSDIIHEDENEIIVNFEMYSDYEFFNQLIINKQTKNIIGVFLNPKISGLAGVRNQLFDVNGEVVAVGKNVYHITEDEVIRLNKGTLYTFDPASRYNIIKLDHSIRFYENIGNDLVLSQFDGENIEHLDTFYNFSSIKPNRIDYLNGKFYYTYSFKLYSRDGSTTKEISAYDYYYDELIIHKNALYFHKDKTIYKYQGEVLSSIGTVTQNNLGFNKSTNHLYISGEGINYEIKNDQLVRIEGADNYYFTELEGKSQNDKTWVTYYNGLGYIKDDKLVDLFHDSLGLVSSDGDMGLMRRFGKTRILNFKTAEWTDLPFITDGRAIGLVIFGSDTLIFSIHDYEREIRISKLKRFKEYEPIFSQKGFISLNYSFYVGGHSHHKLVLIDDVLFSIDQNQEVEMKPGIKVATSNLGTPTFIPIDEHIYFIGNATDAGNQVFRYNIGVSSVDQYEDKEVHLQIFPNPAVAMVNITCPDIDLNGLDFMIYDMQGRRVGEGKVVDNSINVGQLAKGIYNLGLVTKDKILYTRIVKN